MKKKAIIRPVRNKINQQKLSLGIALIVLGFILIFGRGKIVVPANVTFENEPVKISGFTAAKTDDSLLPKRIIIPELGIDLNIGRAKLLNGYWEVFSDKAGWGERSGIPGIPGNQVIFAHAREGLFLPLKKVRTGESIYVLTKDKWFRYGIKEIKEVSPRNTEVITPTDDQTLTLYTCSGFNDSRRLIVVAKPI